MAGQQPSPSGNGDHASAPGLLLGPRLGQLTAPELALVMPGRPLALAAFLLAATAGASTATGLAVVRRASRCSIADRVSTSLCLWSMA